MAEEEPLPKKHRPFRGSKKSRKKEGGGKRSPSPRFAGFIVFFAFFDIFSFQLHLASILLLLFEFSSRSTHNKRAFSLYSKKPSLRNHLFVEKGGGLDCFAFFGARSGEKESGLAMRASLVAPDRSTRKRES